MVVVKVGGIERTIRGDPVTQRITLWDGTDITDMTGPEVRDLILLKNTLDTLGRIKPPPNAKRSIARYLTGAL